MGDFQPVRFRSPKGSLIQGHHPKPWVNTTINHTSSGNLEKDWGHHRRIPCFSPPEPLWPPLRCSSPWPPRRRPQALSSRGGERVRARVLCGASGLPILPWRWGNRKVLLGKPKKKRANKIVYRYDYSHSHIYSNPQLFPSIWDDYTYV